MTYKECLLKSAELRKKDPTAGTENKLIMFLPTAYDKEKYTCLIRWTRIVGYEKAFNQCGYENEDLSIFFYSPETDDLLPI